MDLTRGDHNPDDRLALFRNVAYDSCGSVPSRRSARRLERSCLPRHVGAHLAARFDSAVTPVSKLGTPLSEGGGYAGGTITGPPCAPSDRGPWGHGARWVQTQRRWPYMIAGLSVSLSRASAALGTAKSNLTIADSASSGALHRGDSLSRTDRQPAASPKLQPGPSVILQPSVLLIGIPQPHYRRHFQHRSA